MIDQATELRKLTFNHSYAVNEEKSAAPLLVVSGGKGGVGATTIAVNLAAALAADDHQVLLIETAPCRTDIATLCGLPENYGWETNSSPDTDLTSKLQCGPVGLTVLPASWANPDQSAAESTSQSHHLFQQLSQLQKQYDLVIADVGNQTNNLSCRLRTAADELLLVTTCDPIAVIDSYASLKRKSRPKTGPRVRTLINYASSPQLAADVHQRISQACRRFLGFTSEPLGSIPEEPRLKVAAAHATPFVTHAAETPVAQTLTTMARQLLRVSLSVSSQQTGINRI